MAICAVAFAVAVGCRAPLATLLARPLPCRCAAHAGRAVLAGRAARCSARLACPLQRRRPHRHRPGPLGQGGQCWGGRRSRRSPGGPAAAAGGAATWQRERRPAGGAPPVGAGRQRWCCQQQRRRRRRARHARRGGGACAAARGDAGQLPAAGVRRAAGDAAGGPGRGRRALAAAVAAGGWPQPLAALLYCGSTAGLLFAALQFAGGAWAAPIHCPVLAPSLAGCTNALPGSRVSPHSLTPFSLPPLAPRRAPRRGCRGASKTSRATQPGWPPPFRWPAWRWSAPWRRHTCSSSAARRLPGSRRGRWERQLERAAQQQMRVCCPSCNIPGSRA